MTPFFSARRATLTGIGAALVLAAGVTPSAAALPPGAQRAAEVHAVIDAALDVFGIAPIDAVTYSGPDLYAVMAGDCTLTVQIVDIPTRQPAGFVGPRTFTAIAGDPECRAEPEQ